MNILTGLKKIDSVISAKIQWAGILGDRHYGFFFIDGNFIAKNIKI